jgi:group I intron endonuclease
MKIKSGIYKIVNIVNGKFYIGSSIDINKRWVGHKRMLRKNNHDNGFLQKSWNKHGENNFKFEIVIDKTELIVREQFYLDSMKPFNKNVIYNICEYAGNMLGFKHSKESKEKMSKKHKGNQYCLGYKHSNDTKKNMSKGQIGRKHNEKTINKMILNSIGRNQKEDTKQKLSTINKGKPGLNKIKVYQLDLNNEVIKLWDSISEAANCLGITATSICSVCNRRCKTANGFKWKYFEEPKRLNLTDELKEKIKKDYKSGLFSTRKLAEIYNVSKSTIWLVIKNT